MSKITGVSALWDTTASVQKADKTKEAFSKALFEMKNGKEKKSSEDEEQVTIQRTMPDGSVLVMVMQGDEIISQTKIGGGSKMDTLLPGAHDGDVVDVTGSSMNGVGKDLTDRFNDTSASILLGSVFNEGV